MRLQEKDIKKIVIFRALQLGDMLCAIPAIRALRSAYPNSHITLVGLPWAEFLLERFPGYFDALIKFPGYPGFPEREADVMAFPSFLQQVQDEQFDLAIQMQGNGTTSNPLVKLFNAKQTAGFYKKGNYCPDENLFIEYPDGSEIKRHIKLMQHLGVEPKGVEQEFPLTKEDEIELEKLSLPIKPYNYVCIHPGARDPKRRWSPEYFAALGDYCITQGLPVVITGTNEERSVVEAVTGFMKEKPIEVIGTTSLGAMGVLVKNAFALISNCTGVSHMASAFKTKSIVISPHQDPLEYIRWAPINKDLHKFIDWPRTADFNIVLEETKKLLNDKK